MSSTPNSPPAEGATLVLDTLSATPLPKSKMPLLMVNASANEASPIRPPAYVPADDDPTAYAGLMAMALPEASFPLLSLPTVSVSLVALPIRPPAAFSPATLSAETSMPVGRATVAPSRASPIRPPALASAAVALASAADALMVGVPLRLSGRVRPASVSDAPSARVFTSKPMLPVLDCISTARGLFALVV